MATVLQVDGPALANLRKSRTLTRIEAAVAIGISPTTLAKAEDGGRLQPRVVRQIAGFYEIDPADLLDGDGEEATA